MIGAPDPRWGEALVAFVSFADGMKASSEDLLAFCRERLAPYKLPKIFAPIAALPRNANGKVLKTELRALHDSCARTAE